MALVYEDFECTAETAAEMLREHGVAVIPNVLDTGEVQRLRDGMFEMLGTITKHFPTPITREPRTWGQYMALHPMRHAMLHDFGVGHAQVAWDVRQNPRVAGAFAAVWGVPMDSLLTSSDGMAIHFPPEAIAAAAREDMKEKGEREGSGAGAAQENADDDDDDDPVDPGGALANSYYRGSDWFHVDQAPGRPSWDCVQGLVTAYDAGDGDGTLAVLRGSNKHFADFAEEFSLQGNTAMDWHSVREGAERDFYMARGCARVNVRCKAGSLVLWDSRTVHCGCHPQRRRAQPTIRFVVYVCMKPLPASRADRVEALKRKKEILEKRQTSSHWPDGRATFDDYMVNATNGCALGSLPPPVLTPLGLLLAGNRRPDDSDGDDTDDCTENEQKTGPACVVA